MRRVYRRVCLLRAAGEIDEAAALEHGELRGAVAAARIASDGAPDEAAAIFAEEADRVASAQTLAELLAPLLAARLGREPSAAPGVPATPVSAASDPPASEAAGRHASGEVPPIADLIDSMLAQQNAPRRRGR